ncbi:MerR family transcriptional regulator [Rehaibacterium terrae]|jgi:MerR family mercuric resistance operon transcriptional regulator|uniref:MerR family mercuric resistance operon transcriptional regulator n=1 Tax=Rehaibacterium terrae TaxID=1341696 RepID=A0A7W7XZJ9_9GAMM|nr:MerR family transcriptional regulator [Rehaibacterium terrae]MBB5015356.1 MerR family mercuric resistance operon transcriptional regulator [Rehaibacterium terrae]
MAAKPFSIGRLAAAAGVHVETVRYYQRRGLLDQPVRPLGGIRRYGPADLERLRFIRRAKAMGFSLDEIADLSKIAGHRACERTRRLTEHKLAQVRERLEALRRLEAELVRLVAACSRHDGDECPTLGLLADAVGKPAGRHRRPPRPIDACPAGR